MKQNENTALIKTMFKCALQLLMVAGVVAIVVVISKIIIGYSGNIWNTVLFVNNLFLPSKHFIQDNIWYFAAAFGVSILWLTCVFFKTPKEHVNSLTMLTKILLGVLIYGELLLLCVADMNKGGGSGLLFIISFFIPIGIWTLIRCLMGEISEIKLKLNKESQQN